MMVRIVGTKNRLFPQRNMPGTTLMFIIEVDSLFGFKQNTIQFIVGAEY